MPEPMEDRVTNAFSFAIEKVVVSLEVLREIHVDHVSSTHFLTGPPMGQRPFQSKTEGNDALHSSGTSRSRDLGNPLGFEA